MIRRRSEDFMRCRPTTAAVGRAVMVIRQRCVIQVAGSGIPASRADTERRSNARSKSESALASTMYLTIPTLKESYRFSNAKIEEFMNWVAYYIDS